MYVFACAVIGVPQPAPCVGYAVTIDIFSLNNLLKIVMGLLYHSIVKKK